MFEVQFVTARKKNKQSYTHLFELEIRKYFETEVEGSAPKCSAASDPNCELAVLCLVL